MSNFVVKSTQDTYAMLFRGITRNPSGVRRNNLPSQTMKFFADLRIANCNLFSVTSISLPARYPAISAWYGSY